MPTYEISSYGFFTSNYEAINVKNDEDAFEAEQDFFRLGYGATMDHNKHDSIEISENWDWSFNLLDEHGIHFATVERNMSDCCSPEYYQILRENDTDSNDDDDNSDDGNVWFTIHEDSDEWFDPDFVFRRVEQSGKTLRVARLSTEVNICSQHYMLSVTSKNDIPILVAAAVIIVRILEQKRRQEQAHQNHHVAATMM